MVLSNFILLVRHVSSLNTDLVIVFGLAKFTRLMFMSQSLPPVVSNQIGYGLLQRATSLTCFLGPAVRCFAFLVNVFDKCPQDGRVQIKEVEVSDIISNLLKVKL